MTQEHHIYDIKTRTAFESAPYYIQFNEYAEWYNQEQAEIYIAPPEKGEKTGTKVCTMSSQKRLQLRKKRKKRSRRK